MCYMGGFQSYFLHGQLIVFKVIPHKYNSNLNLVIDLDY